MITGYFEQRWAPVPARLDSRQGSDYECSMQYLLRDIQRIHSREGETQPLGVIRFVGFVTRDPRLVNLLDRLQPLWGDMDGLNAMLLDFGDADDVQNLLVARMQLYIHALPTKALDSVLVSRWPLCIIATKPARSARVCLQAIGNHPFYFSCVVANETVLQTFKHFVDAGNSESNIHRTVHVRPVPNDENDLSDTVWDTLKAMIRMAWKQGMPVGARTSGCGRPPPNCGRPSHGVVPTGRCPFTDVFSHATGRYQRSYQNQSFTCGAPLTMTMVSDLKEQPYHARSPVQWHNHGHMQTIQTQSRLHFFVTGRPGVTQSDGRIGNFFDLANVYMDAPLWM